MQCSVSPGQAGRLDYLPLEDIYAIDDDIRVQIGSKKRIPHLMSSDVEFCSTASAVSDMMTIVHVCEPFWKSLSNEAACRVVHGTP